MTMPEPVTLPCGCFINPVIEDGVRVLKLSPCSPDCEYVRFSVEEAGRQGKPVERRIAP